MDRKELASLLRKYLYGQLTEEEIGRLKDGIIHTEKHLLAEHLQELWANHEGQGTRNREAYNHILQHIREATGQPKRFRLSAYLWRAAVAVVLPVLLLSTVYLLFERHSFETFISQEYSVQAQKGERAAILLPDGTKVYLNSESTLSYPTSFALNNRTVRLSGEAYFEVTHDEKSPFVVHTPTAQIKVLGTTFNLFAYPDNSWFEATLIEGSVEIKSFSHPNKMATLNPDQKVRYNKSTGEWTVSNADIQLATAWKRGDLIFRGQSLKDVFPLLESFYGMNIQVEGACPEEMFTGSYHESDINQVLKNLQYHYHFTFSKSGNNIHIIFK
jgi:ferric-dicitrate binding protein FerR (iron transport regulator)